ncbi:MAG: crotonase/enoyl-CoA hydratase family protein [Polyangiales bacterium]
MSELVQVRTEGSITHVTMDDGKVNALSLPMLQALHGALDQAERAGSVVLLSGRAGVFCAGFDLPVLRGGGEAARTLLQTGFGLALRMLAFPTPIVIACTGHALAMGSFVLLSADYRVGAAGAFKLGANEAAIGLTLPRVAVEICRHRLLPSHLHRALALAEIYAPERAVEAGFLDEVVAADALAETAHTRAAQLAKLDMAAHAGCKQRVRAPGLAAMHAAVEADRAASV